MDEGLGLVETNIAALIHLKKLGRGLNLALVVADGGALNVLGVAVLRIIVDYVYLVFHDYFCPVHIQTLVCLIVAPWIYQINL